jgi:hypothetical protein
MKPLLAEAAYRLSRAGSKKGSNLVYGGFAHREPNGNQVAEWEQILRLAPGDQAVRHELMRVGRTVAHVGG